MFFLICVKNRLAALEPIIFLRIGISVWSREEGAFFVSSRSWAFFEASEAIFKECVC